MEKRAMEALDGLTFQQWEYIYHAVLDARHLGRVSLPRREMLVVRDAILTAYACHGTKEGKGGD